MLPQSRYAAAAILLGDFHTLCRHGKGVMEAYVLHAINPNYGSTTALRFAIVSVILTRQLNMSFRPQRSGEPESRKIVKNTGFPPQFIPHLMRGGNDKM